MHHDQQRGGQISRKRHHYIAKRLNPSGRSGDRDYVAYWHFASGAAACVIIHPAKRW
jgi:hypothetical protein